jgi:type III pantothenate kinase
MNKDKTMDANFTLCLDVGNSNMLAGLYAPDGSGGLRFRKNSTGGASADEYGIFLKAALRENGFDPACVGRIGICSVVPDTVYSIRRACQKYFGIEPFLLKAGVKTGLSIAYRNPAEVGADRIANAIAASRLYPGRDAIVADFGTATTFDVLTAGKKYLGGAIAPGLRISMEALEQKTARLPSVEILKPESALGRSTVESIQSGLFFGHVGMVREMVSRISAECFPDSRPAVLATGGFSHLFADSGLFEAILPDLVLDGLYFAMNLNQEQNP